MGGERGQAALEAALAVPIFVLLVLGVIQLACVQQARALLEGAAFSAARSGSVWSGDPTRMTDAVRFAMLPAVGPSFDGSHLEVAWRQSGEADTVLRAAGLAGGAIRVETLAPSLVDFPTTPEGPAPELEHDRAPNDGPVELRVRARFFDELRVPFASTIIFLCFFAVRASETLAAPIVGLVPPPPELGARAQEIATEEGEPIASRVELMQLWSLARPVTGEPRYFLPLSAEARFRMQSSFHRRYLAGGAR